MKPRQVESIVVYDKPMNKAIFSGRGQNGLIVIKMKWSLPAWNRVEGPHSLPLGTEYKNEFSPKNKQSWPAALECGACYFFVVSPTLTEDLHSLVN
jgi:hypothetical protein